MPYKEGKKWRGVVRLQGRRPTKLFLTKKEAILWEAAERAQILNPQEEMVSGPNYMTLCAEYLDYSTRFQASTYQEKKRLSIRTLKYFGADTLCEEINSRLILNYLNERANTVSNNAFNKDRKNLLAMFAWGMKFMSLTSNPVIQVERLAHDREPQYTPFQEDVLKILAATTPEERVFLNCYLHTGARRSEIFRLTWTEDINFEKRQIRLGTRKTRDSSMRYDWLPMSDALHESLSWWWNHRPVKNALYVFVNSDKRSVHYGKPFAYRQKFMKKLCERAGVKPFGFHALRRYVASILADTHKVSAKTIQRILRHQSVVTTEKYIKNVNNDLEATMNLLDGEKRHNEGHNDKKKGFQGNP